MISTAIERRSRVSGFERVAERSKRFCRSELRSANRLIVFHYCFVSLFCGRENGDAMTSKGPASDALPFSPNATLQNGQIAYRISTEDY